MTENEPVINTIAPLVNISLCALALDRAINRQSHLPGLVTFYGESGLGKSFSASYSANRYRAYYIECKSSWTRKAMLIAILKSMGIVPAKNNSDMTDQVSEELALSGRPLIIDEMDYIVEKKAVEVIQDIYEGSNAAILMIGEEKLPSKLKKWERFHNRMLDWVPAQRADLNDVDLLSKLYSPDVAIAQDLLDSIQKINKGCVRRICVNIERVRASAKAVGKTEIDLATWSSGKRELFTGEAPKRRF